MISYKLRYALNKSYTLFIAAILMTLISSFSHFPSFNLQIITFAFLNSSVLFEIRENRERLWLLLKIYLATFLLQICMGVSHKYLFSELIFTSIFSALVLNFINNKSAVMVVFICSYLNYFVNTDFIVAVNRGIELLISAFVAYFVSFIGQLFLPFKEEKVVIQTYSVQEKISIICEIFTAILLANLFPLKQGIWVVLTIFFIRLALDETHTIEQLSARRIFSVPLGMWMGIVFLSGLIYLNYRFFYLIPVFGALGFFVLYYWGNFFFFSLLFMFTFMIYADYSVGVYREFYPWQLLLGRSLATLYGVLIVLVANKINKWGCKSV